MITQTVIEIFIKFFMKILEILPVINFTFPDSLMKNLSTVFNGIAYFFPVTAIIPILSFELILFQVKIVLALIRLVKSFIPTMGGV